MTPTSKKLCVRCNRFGHFENECFILRTGMANSQQLEQASTPVPRKGNCYKCGRWGHFVRSCPYKSTAGKSFKKILKCVSCNKKGHISFNCPYLSTGSAKNLYKKSLACNICNETAHFSGKCPNVPALTKKHCFRCKMAGHLEANCLSKSLMTHENFTCYKKGQKVMDCPNGPSFQAFKAHLKSKKKKLNKSATAEQLVQINQTVLSFNSIQPVKPIQINQDVIQTVQQRMRQAEPVVESVQPTEHVQCEDFVEMAEAVKNINFAPQIQQTIDVDLTAQVSKTLEPIPLANQFRPGKFSLESRPLIQTVESYKAMQLASQTQFIKPTVILKKPSHTNMICFSCKQIGHIARNCIVKAMLANLCYTCRQPGHLARNCRISRSTIKERTQTCFTCKKCGHATRNCPN